VRRSAAAQQALAPGFPAVQALEDSDFVSTEPEEIQEPSIAGANAPIPGTWEAPPVRAPGLGMADGASPGTAVAEMPALAPAPAAEGVRRSRQRARWIVLGLLLVLGGGLGSGFYIARGSRAGNETERFDKAQKLYDEHNFAEAAAELQGLHRDFPDSRKRHHYEFLRQLAAVRDAVYAPQGAPDSAFQLLKDFLSANGGDPLLKSFEGDLWQTLHKSAKELTEEADQRKDRRLVGRARLALREAAKFEAPRGTAAERRMSEAEEKLSGLEKEIAVLERRQAYLVQLKNLAKKPSADAVREARALLHEAGFAGDAEFQHVVRDLLQNHLAGVTFVLVSESSQHKTVVIDREPSFLITPLLHKPGPAPRVHGTVFALVRGILHALDARTGDVRWARRVGVDSTLLPVRLPAGPANPAIALFTSTDHNTVWAVEEETGRTIWEHQLDGPCLAQPVLIGSESGIPGNRLLVPCYSGRVEELALGDGRLLGYYRLGQTLTVGGIYQPGTAFAYFPADDYSVYALDIVRRTCAAVLYSGHPRGALRSAPVIITEPGAGADGKGLLILSQEAENDAVKLRSFALPITSPDQPPAAPDIRIPGWSWFPPYQDGERLAVATDAAVLALYGLGQKGNRDPLFFPLLENDVSLDSARQVRLGRAQIVHADAENFWVLTHGRLQRVQLTFVGRAGPKSGPRTIHRWPEPPLLGSPLHDAQVLEDEMGKTLLFLVTRIGGGQTCLATLIDADTGRTVWQRQIGIGGHGTPLQAGNDILIDDRAGLLRFDALKPHNSLWQPAGELLASYSRQTAKRFAFASEKNKSAYIAHFADTSLKVFRYEPGQDKKLTSNEYTLPRPLAGTPCLGTDCLVVPLDNGVLLRVPLGGGPMVQGPTWRAAAAEEGAQGHVIVVGPNDLIYTDGNRSLGRWSDLADSKPKELPRRIVTPPVVIPAATAEKKTRLCVADADDTLTLLDSENLGVMRSWRMPGKITSGPFVRGPNIACVIGGRLLVWIDPDKDEILWQYAPLTDIVGRPHVVHGMVVVANLAGHIMSLDPATGRPLGPGYTLRAEVAPAATPLPFTADRLFVPLTDGTVMLLAEKLLH
jgi:outer membrane protein assembly factor BamB